MLAVLSELRPMTQRDTLCAFECPEIARTARPGQFVELKLTHDRIAIFCGRAYICDTDGQRIFSLLIHNGIAQSAGWTAGAQADVLGPFGFGFSWTAGDHDCVLIAEGAGLAPMAFLSRRLLAAQKQVRLLGFAPQDLELMKQLSLSERVGIVPVEGHSALPAALVSILRHNVDAVFLCGSERLLETAAEYAAGCHAPCQFLLE